MKGITERQFTQQVIQLLKLCGFDLVYHTFNSMHSVKGFPDVVDLWLSDTRLLFAELKSDNGKVTDEQVGWIMALREAGQEAHIWRPAEWDSIVRIIQEAKGE